MSTQRDRVAKAIAAADKEIESYGAVTTGPEPRYQELLYGPTSDMAENIVEAVLKELAPRIITTDDEIRELRTFGTLLRDADDRLVEHVETLPGHHRWYWRSPDAYMNSIWPTLPATVLYEA